MRDLSLLQKATDELGNVPAQVFNVVEEKPEVRASDIVGLFADYMTGYMSESRGAEKIMQDNGLGVADVKAYLEYLFVLRLEQVSGRRSSAYGTVEVPVCIYPLLESIGNYENSEEGVYINPVSVDTAKLPNNADKLVRAMRIAGFEFSNSLPLAKAIESDLIYRLSVKDGVIYSNVGGTSVDPVTLLVRIFYDFQELNSVYGTFRYNMGNVKVVGSALDALARLGMPGKTLRP